VPDEKEIESSAYLEDRQLMFLQCAMEENCLASSAYNISKEDYGMSSKISHSLLKFSNNDQLIRAKDGFTNKDDY
jgi:lysyl oxidase-like protein 2/3/4